MTRTVLYLLGLCLILPYLSQGALGKSGVQTSTPAEEVLNLRDFGAVGDGVADDAQAFRDALDALATAGGGTLFIPEGKYVIATPVIKNFTGLASSITITGVESSTPVPPPTAPGHILSLPLDLPTEIYPRTGEENPAIRITGLKNFVIKEIAFVGTPTARTDASETLALGDIDKALVKHCEFYGLSTLAVGGSIVVAVRSNLEITQSKFLGTTATSGGYLPVVQNLEWKSITVTDTIFLDYGLRPELFSKTFLAAPISWINIGNAAQPTPDSPRREVLIRNVFLDEGGFWGLSSMPFRYLPQTAPIDLVYVTGLKMNVSNFFQYGHHLHGIDRVFVEKSRYGWSQNAAAAINLIDVGSAIVDQVVCEADADRIHADADTNELTVINSTYGELLSFAQITNTVNTAPEDDPVQYVRERFNAVLGRAPDLAAHYYWSDLLVHCFNDSNCKDTTKAALNSYLSSSPATVFRISGLVTHENGTPLANVPVTVSGTHSQSVTALTNSDGEYAFSNLPTSGRYVVTAITDDFVFVSPNNTFTAPIGNRTANFTSRLKNHRISGTVANVDGPVAGVTITLTGSANATAISDDTGQYSFDVPRHGNYLVAATKAHHNFEPGNFAIVDLTFDRRVDFIPMLQKHTISGRVLNGSGQPVAGVSLTLSGSVNRSTTTASDGTYSFTNVDAGSNCTLTASKARHLMSPFTHVFNNLSAAVTADFSAKVLPTLLAMPDSDRAVALELTQLVPEPFPLTSVLLSEGPRRARVIFFGTELGLLPGEGVEVITAEAEDAMQVKHNLRVEFVNPLPDLPHISQIVLRLDGDLSPTGDVLVSLTIHGFTSNKVRITIEP